MSDGFSAFKAMAVGVGFLLAVTSVAPSVTNGRFDPLSLAKGKGKGKSTLPGDSSGSTGDTTTTDGGMTGSTGGTTGTTSNSFYTEETMVPSNFDIYSELISVPLPASAAPDVVGAFRFVCSAGQVLNDDPIVYPGQPGKSHAHQFYGNTSANASSTYSSLRSNGQSTCMSPLNRSAYWKIGRAHV